MSRRLAVSIAAMAFAAAAASQAQAQNMTITGARIIVGNGQVIENGSMVVRNGKIASVTPGAAPAGAPAQRIDASGFTLIAGYIDGHRHLIQGNPDAFLKDRAADAMRELLEAGVTTVQSGGDNDAAIVSLKKMVESGQIKGPRIITSGRVPTANLKTEEEVRAAVRRVVAAGADSIAEVHYPITEPPSTNKPTEQESKNMAAAIDEARKLGVEFQIHASAPDPMVQAVKLGGRKLVHTPHFFWVTPEQAKAVKDSGAWMASCTGFGVPVFDVFNRDNKPTFRDGKPWPEGIIASEGRGQEGGMKVINGRTLFDAGVDYGFCTDTTYWAPAAIAHEIKTLSLAFSPLDLVKIMGQNSADFVNMGKDLGTLEVGKTADVLVLTNNPIENAVNFNNPVVVLRGGAVVLDRRAELKTVRELPYRRPPVYVAPPPGAGRAPAGD